MNKHKLLASVRLGLGVVSLGAILVQLISSISRGSSVSNFFSFFTIQSNLVAALLLVTVGAYILLGKSGRTVAYLRGALTLYMTMTGVIYVLLLSGYEQALQTTIPAVNIILHYIMPVVILADWLAFPPDKKLLFRIALVCWLAYPLLYLAYSLIRGAITGWYPYPFINPTLSGWPNLIGTSLTIALGSLALTWLLVQRTSVRRR
ncbi:MAG TPA: Pr6Pr family membrane protein [Candidatus Saccharimonadales bacterium]|nr:Pr6Pr family membrane protein [Candidatus Saccharimonadales bacterium]